MSDNLSTFIRKADAMIDALEQYVERVAHHYTINIAGHLIRFTPGEGLQYPEDTDYVPTGRLRGGWHLSGVPIGSTSRYEGGPYSLWGDEAVARIQGDVGAMGVPERVYIVNDVAYGYMIQWGLGNHSTGRPGRDWVERTPDRADLFLREAQQEARAS